VIEDAYQAEEDAIQGEFTTEQENRIFTQTPNPQTLQAVRQALADEQTLRQAEQAARGLEQAQTAQEEADRVRLEQEIRDNQTARVANAEQREAMREQRRSAMRTPTETIAANNAERATATAENESDIAIGNWRSTNGTLQAARDAINNEIQLRSEEQAARNTELEARNHAGV